MTPAMSPPSPKAGASGAARREQLRANRMRSRAGTFSKPSASHCASPAVRDRHLAALAIIKPVVVGGPGEGPGTEVAVKFHGAAPDAVEDRVPAGTEHLRLGTLDVHFQQIDERQVEVANEV